MPTLYIVATPIGNLEDITLRALRVLGEVDVIFCEDTRVTNKLLKHYKINKPLKIFHQHSPLRSWESFAGQAQNIAYVTDAGTSGVSDPGAKLAQIAREAGWKVVPIPGPSALITLLSVAGMSKNGSTKRNGGDFVFLGFLPHKKGRQTLLKEIAQAKRAYVVYEAPSRIARLFRELSEHCGHECKLVVGRELTKMFEEVWQGTTMEATSHFVGNHARGEFVILI
ncbi:MAG: 16S rRNA (cytidine(1402)-2'-O)-methyltransferase, partial [Parcubacteria group bacterium RIFCSPHIGHO2_01_FULL_45_26]